LSVRHKSPGTLPFTVTCPLTLLAIKNKIANPNALMLFAFPTKLLPSKYNMLSSHFLAVGKMVADPCQSKLGLVFALSQLA
jgi:hypothetical protein